MHQGKLVFAQVMAHLPLSTFRRGVARYDGEHKVKSFSCLDQFYAMAFAQLTFRESLRDIEACLATQTHRLYHLGFRSPVARNTLANANAVRPWQIYADLAQHLIGIARPLYANESIGLDLKETVYAFDATTIDLCLSVYPWAPFRSTKAAIKLHTLLDVRGSIPTFIHISDGKMHEVNVLDALTPEPGAFYLLDRGYMDVGRLHALHEAGSFFLIRAKRITFLTNNTTLAPEIMGELYRLRWQVELFFKWIKQHLRIKAFFGTSENAVKTQIWIAIATYVLIAIVKKRAMLPHSLYELLQILSLTMFETTPINQLLTTPRRSPDDDSEPEQLALL